jgi:RHS repeat-associated protein
VLVTVSDKKLSIDATNDGLGDYYKADVITAGDYAPFGMALVGRKFAVGSGGYRYGFNGQEKDNSTGEGNLDFGARIMDVRLGRFLSSDPLSGSYPYYSPYLFANNNPIACVDFNGLSGGGDPPGFSQRTSADGDHILLPSDAKIEYFDETGEGTAGKTKIQFDPGSVRSFTLASGKRYIATFNAKNGAFMGYKNYKSNKIYPSTLNYKNFVLLPNNALVKADADDHDKFGSAYAGDRLLFSNQAAASNGALVSLRVGSVEDAADQLKNYCDENACVISNLINDFHGAKGFFIGGTWLGNSNISTYEGSLKKMGVHMDNNTQVLFGNCNSGRLAKSALTLVHSYFNNAVIYAHQSYCMSTTLLAGCYADKKGTAKYFGGDVEAAKYVDIWLKIVAGKQENVKGVRFRVWADFSTPGRPSATGNIGDIYEK